ncbi:MAG: hypothetical protein COB53_03565 [Elusimicrobia bacterium]|nr:MAG: hypothetical protein COB53_03565 [Elusimicrobiota bacterium]
MISPAFASASPGLTLEQMAGRLLMPTIDAAFVEKHAEEIRAGYLLAGMLAWDKHSAGELKALRKRLDVLTGDGERFVLAVDHEGGPLFTQRTAGLTIFPGNMALGATGDPDLAAQAARTSAAELSALGIGIVFAPVADVNSDPSNPIISIRAFGDDPATVSRFVSAAVRGYQQGGVIPVVKHFPGHGDTDTDSHTGLPVIDKSSMAIHAIDLVPFRGAFKVEGIGVMTAHIRVPALGSGTNPATLSAAILRKLLREEMGFNGVVVSDSLEMKGVLKGRSVAAAAVQALQAGCDLLLIGRSDSQEVRRAILAAVSEERIKEAYQRRFGGRAPGFFEDEPLEPAHIAERSVTLLRDRGGLLPMKGRGGTTLFIIHRSKRFAIEAEAFENAIKAQYPAAEILFLNPKPSPKEASEALRRSRLAGKVVVSSYHWGRKPFPKQKRLIQRLLQLKKPVVFVSAMSPYDVPFYPEAKTVVLTYGFTKAALQAAVRLIAGEIRPKGRLPVSLSSRIPRGSGLGAFRQ